MYFQSAVNINLGFGIVGEKLFDSPSRVESLTLDASGGTVGNYFTKSNTTGVATQGGTIAAGVVAAGFLVNPKAYSSNGAANPLDPTLVLPGNSQGEFLTMGEIVVNMTTAANIGDLVEYNLTTGVLAAVAPAGVVTAGFAFIPNCTVERYPTTAAGLVVIRVTN